MKLIDKYLPFVKDAKEIALLLQNRIVLLISQGNTNVDSIINSIDVEGAVVDYYKAKAVDPALIAMIVEIVVPIVIEILKVAIPLIIEAMKKKEEPAEQPA